MTKFLDLFRVFSYICGSNCTGDCSLLWQDLFLIEMFIEANKMRFCAIMDRFLISLRPPSTVLKNSSHLIALKADASNKQKV